MKFKYLLVLPLLAASLQAATLDDLTFTLNDDSTEYSVTDCDTAASGSLEIPSTYNDLPVTSIRGYAFLNCTSLESITIPDSVTLIGDVPFGRCSSLTSINLSNANAYYTANNGVLFNKNEDTLITYPAGKSGEEFTVPDSVTSIAMGSFYGCSSLTSVTIPDSVTSIGEGAFSLCSSLTSITIPESVTSIGDRAFYDCSSLTSVIIPNSVTTLGTSIVGNTTGVFLPNDRVGYQAADHALPVGTFLTNAMYDAIANRLQQDDNFIVQDQLSYGYTTISGAAIGKVMDGSRIEINSLGHYIIEETFNNATNPNDPNGPPISYTYFKVYDNNGDLLLSASEIPTYIHSNGGGNSAWLNDFLLVDTSWGTADDFKILYAYNEKTNTYEINTTYGTRLEWYDFNDGNLLVNLDTNIGYLFNNGTRGLQGIQGPKGDKGDTGAQGIIGLKGDKGDQGSQGAKGDKGDTGAQGLQGLQGERGAPGEKGDKGDTGPQGPPGLDSTAIQTLKVSEPHVVANEDGTFNVQYTVQSSDDLSTWTDEEIIDATISAESTDKQFLRIGVDGSLQNPNPVIPLPPITIEPIDTFEPEI